MRKTFLFVALVAALAGRPTLVDHAWSLFASIWGGSCADQPGGCAITPQGDEGLGMDPDGKPGSFTPQTDEGLGMDPNGKPGS